MSEKRTQNMILLEFGALPFIRLHRQNVGKVRDDKGRWHSFGLPGMADISGFLSCGKRVEIEVKSAKGTLRKDQRTWRDVCKAFGVLWVLARSTEDVADCLNEHIQDCETCAFIQSVR